MFVTGIQLLYEPFESWVVLLFILAASTALIVILTGFIAKLTTGKFEAGVKNLIKKDNKVVDICIQSFYAVIFALLAFFIVWVMSCVPIYDSAYLLFSAVSIIAIIAGIYFGPIPAFATALSALLCTLLIHEGTDYLMTIGYAIAVFLLGVGAGFYGYYCQKETNCKFLNKLNLTKNGVPTQLGAVILGGAITGFEFIFMFLFGLGDIANSIVLLLITLIPLAIVNVGGLWLTSVVFGLYGNKDYHFVAGEQIKMDKWFAKKGEEVEEADEEVIEESTEEAITEEPQVEEPQVEEPTEDVVEQANAPIEAEEVVETEQAEIEEETKTQE